MSVFPDLWEAIWAGSLGQIEDIILPEATLSRSVIIWRDSYTTSGYNGMPLSRVLILGCDGSFQVGQSW